MAGRTIKLMDTSILGMAQRLDMTCQEAYQHRHDARGQQLGEARLVGRAQHLLALGLAQGVSRARPHGLRSTIPGNKTCPHLPSLHCSHIDPGGVARQAQV